jgi:hypothetical protein
VTATRVLLLSMPGMLRELLARTVASEPDFELVDDMPEASERLEAAARLGADAVVVALEGGAPIVPPTLIVIDPSGRDAVLYRPDAVSLGELSPEKLLEALRQVRRRA